MLWVDGQISSSFFPVKISRATMWTLACPCLPVLEVDISTILHGRFLIMTKPFFLRAEHCMGKVSDAPASAAAKSSSAAIFFRLFVDPIDVEKGTEISAREVRKMRLF